MSHTHTLHSNVYLLSIFTYHKFCDINSQSGKTNLATPFDKQQNINRVAEQMKDRCSQFTHVLCTKKKTNNFEKLKF